MLHRQPDLTDALLAAARAAGADAAEASARSATSLSIDVRQGNLEKAERSEGVEVSLKVFVGQRHASVSASDTAPDTITRMAERAIAMAREAPVDPYAGLADPSQLAQHTDATRLDLFDPAPEPDPAALEDESRRAEAAAMAIPGVTQVSTASAGYGHWHGVIAATNGFVGHYRQSDRGIACVAISGTGTGMERDYDHDNRVHASDLRSAEDIGLVAGQRAAERAGATRPKTGTYPVLFDERVASSLIGHLLQAINGSAITRGSSWLRDALGQQVLPAGLSVTEDPHRPRAFASRLFDGEGLPTTLRDIVADGILTGWTLDLATGRQLGLPSTGNAGRGGGPSLSNIALTQGSHSRADLIGQMGTGLLVTSMIGSTINPNTGDYSRGAAGFWVQNGQISHPVNECTIAGNLRDMLMRIIPANDARPHLSRVVPSLLIDNMVLAGA